MATSNSNLVRLNHVVIPMTGDVKVYLSFIQGHMGFGKYFDIPSEEANLPAEDLLTEERYNAIIDHYENKPHLSQHTFSRDITKVEHARRHVCIGSAYVFVGTTDTEHYVIELRSQSRNKAIMTVRNHLGLGKFKITASTWEDEFKKRGFKTAMMLSNQARV